MQRLVAAILVSCFAASASASTANLAQWALGAWECTLDGRPATMAWRIAERQTVEHRDGVARTTTSAEAVGEFRDNGGPVARLTALSSEGSQFRFRHQDGNIWGLSLGADGVAYGFSIWNRTRYPLVCRRPQPPPPPPTLQQAPENPVRRIDPGVLTPRNN